MLAILLCSLQNFQPKRRMKFAAIYNVWFDSIELLHYSIKSIKDHVDHIIIVWQNTSNFGENMNTYDSVLLTIANLSQSKDFNNDKFHIVNIEPDLSLPPYQLGPVNEKNKRNKGLEVAKLLNCTHFLFMDSDELYADFGKAKQQFIDSGAKGSVCKMWTYFKKPTLRFENHEGYFVPFIHELRPDTIAGVREYPFYVDPTRRINETNVVEIEEKMYHFSYVRKDIEMKLRNSSARDNIAKGTVLYDYNNPDVGAGFYVRDFQMKLVEDENLFGIQI